MCILYIPLFVFLDKIVYLYSDVIICIRNPYISHHHICFSDTVSCLFHFIFEWVLAHLLLINSISIIKVNLCKYFQSVGFCFGFFFIFFGETSPSTQFNNVTDKTDQNDLKYTGSSFTQSNLLSQIGVKFALFIDTDEIKGTDVIKTSCSY